MIKDIYGALQKIVQEIRNTCDVAVVGMSGGADSSLVTTLCVEALGRENVYGVHMPYNMLDSTTFNSVSRELAEVLGIHSLEAPIQQIATAINDTVGSAFGDQEGVSAPRDILTHVNRGNGRSRARMCVLYGISHHLHSTLTGKRVRVIGTGNLSEDFIGYDTKGGDALADLFPIGELFKSEVYQMLKHFSYYCPKTFGKIIEAKPSAGLWDGQTDEEELGYSYNAMEPVIKEILEADREPGSVFLATTEIERFVEERHLKNRHKHEAPPTIPLRVFCD